MDWTGGYVFFLMKVAAFLLVMFGIVWVAFYFRDKGKEMLGMLMMAFFMCAMFIPAGIVFDSYPLSKATEVKDMKKEESRTALLEFDDPKLKGVYLLKEEFPRYTEYRYKDQDGAHSFVVYPEGTAKSITTEEAAYVDGCGEQPALIIEDGYRHPTDWGPWGKKVVEDEWEKMNIEGKKTLCVPADKVMNVTN
ncbi:MAG: hypothetical protein Q7S53_00625 [bacterium]|nr:hypothetical protein [bacterium]